MSKTKKIAKPPKIDYKLLDSGDGKKLERFGQYILIRPSAQAAWKPQKGALYWQKAYASFARDNGNKWSNRETLPASWEIQIDQIRFMLKTTDFGHLGVFPEQQQLWKKITETLTKAQKQSNDRLSVLNLFAYSGGATLAAAQAGAEVCHVDSAKGMIEWARENAVLNNLQNAPIRWILDDVTKFLKREIRRGRTYNAIILDPPTFGRGRHGEVYKIEKQLYETLLLCKKLLSKKRVFVLLSSHTPGYSPIVLKNLLMQIMGFCCDQIESGELLLSGDAPTFPLPNGTFVFWTQRHKKK
jgi:23S rRNA (cytosine1962-C5)-methyltransferase